MRYITADEAIRSTQEVDAYLGRVSLEVRQSQLPPQAKANFEAWFAQWRASVQDTVNRSYAATTLGAASIVDRAEAARDEGRRWSEQARASGAPTLATGAPSVPGEGAPTIGSLARWIALGFVGLLALEALRTVRSVND